MGGIFLQDLAFVQQLRSILLTLSADLHRQIGIFTSLSRPGCVLRRSYAVSPADRVR